MGNAVKGQKFSFNIYLARGQDKYKGKRRPVRKRGINRSSIYLLNWKGREVLVHHVFRKSTQYFRLKLHHREDIVRQRKTILYIKDEIQLQRINVFLQKDKVKIIGTNELNNNNVAGTTTYRGGVPLPKLSMILNEHDSNPNNTLIWTMNQISNLNLHAIYGKFTELVGSIALCIIVL